MAKKTWGPGIKEEGALKETATTETQRHGVRTKTAYMSHKTPLTIERRRSEVF
jgi:hypothetical protein